MNVVGFCGGSGAGKTTLLERLVPRLRARGLRVSMVKHAHKGFDVDRPGKDTHRFREAGAFEVLIASSHRLALMREHAEPAEPTVHALIAELSACDWVLVEGFKHADLPKIEVWRAATGRPVLYADDPHVVAIATDTPASLPVATTLPVLELDSPEGLADFLLRHAGRFEYRSDHVHDPSDPRPSDEPGRGDPAPPGRDADPA
jgi:molybdopterin-guanine dinucleotide biosynthesis protein B